MTTPNPTPPEQEDWPMQVEKTARAFAYPPTPPLARSVRAALRPRYKAASRQWTRAAALLLIVGCGLLFVPQIRATVFELLRVGAVTFFPPDESIDPPDVTPLAVLLDLPGETTLADARANFTHPIPLPTYPDDLGAPDKVYLPAPSVLVLVWLDASGQPDLSLMLLTPRAYVGKSLTGILTTTTVNNQNAFWMEAPHTLALYTPLTDNGSTELTRLVEGHVLLWMEGELTYRLETGLSLEDARRIAESLR